MVLDLPRLVYLTASALLLPYFLYLGLVTAGAILGRRRRTEPDATSVRFLIVIPAHDEQDTITATLQSCRSVDYDASLLRVLVIADNCTDRTADAARRAGAEVRERCDPIRRSKGYALEDVLTPETIGDASAVVIVDADTVVDPDLLSAFSGAIASGYDWIQCYYTVRNPDASWRTRLMTYAFSLFNGVSLLGQEALGLGAGLKGNGMCFTVRGLDRIAWKACGLVEDLEFSWRLHARGEKIHFLSGSRVYGEMVSRGGEAAVAQRRRWEAGRRDIPRKYLGPVLRSSSIGWYRKLMYVIQMTSPPLATLAVALALVASVHPAALAVPGLTHLSRLLAPAHALMAATLLAYILCPIAVMGLPVKYLRVLLRVPYYAAWKIAVTAGRTPGTWVRTARESLSRSGDACEARGSSPGGALGEVTR